MGKPAARMGDTTAHGGTISLGLPTVLIGKMPAACLGDMHICPMCTPAVPPIPHVGGPISLGSTGVLIGKKPAARVADMTVCVGPPSMPAMGCMTVLVGEVGGGGGGGGGAAAAAKAAAVKGPKAASPFPLAEPPKDAEIHSIECEFTDSAGKPLSGVPYVITDPDKREIAGVSTSDGAAYHGGYAKSGGFKLLVPELKNAKWKKTRLGLDQEAAFSVECDLPADVKTAYVSIIEERGNRRRSVALEEVAVAGKKIEGTWKPDTADIEAPPLEGDESLAGERPAYHFLCEAGGLIVLSDTLSIVDTAEIELVGGDDAGIADAEYEATLPSGEIKKGKTDRQGKVRIADVDPGDVDITFPKLHEPEPEEDDSGEAG
ncbi:MAG: PAAR domain-containing protein [Fibrobacteres bacterium]|nr:PAAR domain-containing protein [Fibrobacterota bacterium]